MGSKPWKAMLRRRVLNSEKYRAGASFKIERAGFAHEGRVEFGTAMNGTPVIFVASDVVRLDRDTLIDGVPAPDWREDR
jgi:hypothetical protein